MSAEHAGPVGLPLTVGRIGRAHGVRGEVTVDVRTDSPDLRFAPGSVLRTEPPERGPLRVVDARWHSGRLLVEFEGVRDRDAAQSLRGVRLVIDSSEVEPLDDPEEFYDHQLVGLAVVATDGTTIGSVTDVIHGPGGDTLVVDHGGAEKLFPFVREIVTEVDVPGGSVRVAPPDGLLDL